MPFLLDDNQFQQQQQQRACASTQTGDESTTIASISECGCLNNNNNNSLSESSFGCSEAAAPTRTKAERKRQFALQFKTQACRAYVAGGMCPYAAKCYFAHGADDFRTPEQNDADGLVTDSAIRAWLRARAEAATNLSGALAGAVIATEQPSKNTSPSRLLEPIAKTSFHEPSIIEPASIRTPQEMAVCGADDSTLFLTSHDGGDLLCGGASFESNSVDSESLLVRPSSAVAARFRYNPYSIYRVKVVM